MTLLGLLWPWRSLECVIWADGVYRQWGHCIDYAWVAGWVPVAW